MAKQLGPFFIRGTIGGICFYKMDGIYYARAKSSLDRKRVTQDPAFRETMRYAGLLGKAATIASFIYKHLNKDKKGLISYRQLTGQAMRLLKENKTEEEVRELLQRQWVEDIPIVVSAKEYIGAGILFAEKVLLEMFGEVTIGKKDFYYPEEIPP
ncbi:hypothetical protein [Terrimonas alba]|uniref:hypothetical protein n=1 Tax=Terrimonas alba TaxID=3349636 RepID=UPI0035F2A4C5